MLECRSEQCGLGRMHIAVVAGSCNRSVDGRDEEYEEDLQSPTRHLYCPSQLRLYSELLKPWSLEAAVIPAHVSE